MRRRDRIRLSGAALRAFLHLAKAWRLIPARQRAALGGVAPATWRCWVALARRRRTLALPERALLRLSLLLGVARALITLRGSARNCAGWLRRRNRPAAGRLSVPLAVLARGSLDDLARFRRDMESMAAGWVSSRCSDAPSIRALRYNDIIHVDDQRGSELGYRCDHGSA
ncbi:hypothetical protein [Roseococcus sp. DSY-14]|uniref:hypothetical protein n=1 Tax=Roseococcus sp. DSY-14 TaxID=3369650 RepID=UPI00387B7EF9